uniref:Granulins-like n=1 Tax=Cyanistes caeruleus TaxID=156563 RepID=A0A8C0ZC02_CYACU
MIPHQTCLAGHPVVDTVPWTPHPVPCPPYQAPYSTSMPCPLCLHPVSPSPGSLSSCVSPQAVCCGDGQHCCPQGTTCDLIHSTCTSLGGSALLCDEETSCPDGNTCCRLSSGAWGCCPLEQVRGVPWLHLRPRGGQLPAGWGHPPALGAQDPGAAPGGTGDLGGCQMR